MGFFPHAVKYIVFRFIIQVHVSSDGWMCDIPWNTGSAGTLYTLLSPLYLKTLCFVKVFFHRIHFLEDYFMDRPEFVYMWFSIYMGGTLLFYTHTDTQCYFLRFISKSF